MKWDLTYFFKDDAAFEEALAQLNNYFASIGGFKGKLGVEAKFKEYILQDREFEKKAVQVYQYAHLRSDLDKKNVKYNSDLSKVMMVFNQLSELTSWVEPEILAIGKDKILGFIDNNPELKEYRFIMEKLFRLQDHVLDERSERLLSFYGPLGSRGGDLYSAIAVADGKPVNVKIQTGYVDVTQGNWRSLIASVKTAKDRKTIFEAIFNKYEEHKNVFAEIYNTVMLTQRAHIKTRKYKSILEANLFRNKIPVSVYKTIVSVASRQNKSLKKYIRLRKKYLNLRDHFTYDRFLPLATSNRKYTYEEALEMFYDSIKSFPNDFQEKAKEVLKEGFVDVYESDGKRSGAYSSSQSDSHPYILLNFNGELDDVFTVAHEAGHSIHSLYAQTQPMALQNYTIFVAEIASTFNEHNLLDYIINSKDASKEEKIMLLQKAIEEIWGTFYRQVLFAQYELIVSQMIEEDKPINHEILSNIMIELYKKYYGLDIKKERVKQYVWAYIPHLFYTPFYVYQYATSFAASLKLYKDVKENVPGAFDRYINLLKSGGSKYPVEQSLDAGIDFTKRDTFLAVVERLDQLVNEIEKLLTQ